MKTTLTILLTFALAYLTSALFELDFISLNPVRYILTVILIILELATGFFLVKQQVKQSIKK